MLFSRWKIGSRIFVDIRRLAMLSIAALLSCYQYISTIGAIATKAADPVPQPVDGSPLPFNSSKLSMSIDTTLDFLGQSI
jgi:hypothetical protein